MLKDALNTMTLTLIGVVIIQFNQIRKCVCGGGGGWGGGGGGGGGGQTLLSGGKPLKLTSNLETKINVIWLPTCPFNS